MLDEFVKLADAPDEKFQGFAERYGLLGLCENHGKLLHDLGNQDCGRPYRD